MQSLWHTTTHTLVKEMVPYCTQMFHVVDMRTILECAQRMIFSHFHARVGKQLDFSVENVCQTLCDSFNVMT